MLIHEILKIDPPAVKSHIGFRDAAGELVAAIEYYPRRNAWMVSETAYDMLAGFGKSNPGWAGGTRQNFEARFRVKLSAVKVEIHAAPAMQVSPIEREIRMRSIGA